MGNFCSSGSDTAKTTTTTRKERYSETPTAERSQANESEKGSTEAGLPSWVPKKSATHQQYPLLFAPETNATALACCGGSTLAVGSESGALVIVDALSGKTLGRLDNYHARDINKLNFHRSSQLLFSCSRDKTLKALRLDQSGTASASPMTFEGHELVVTCQAVNPDATLLASGSRDNSVRIWDVERQIQLSSQDVKLNVVHSCAWIPEMQVVAQGGEDLTIRLWDVRTPTSMTLAHTISNFDYHPICMMFPTAGSTASTGHTIITGHNGFNGTGAMISVWDLRMRQLVEEMRGHKNTVRWLCAKSDGRQIGDFLSASDDGTIKEWSSSKEVGTYPVPEGRMTALVPLECDDRLYAGSCRSGTVFIARRTGDIKDAELTRERHFGPDVAAAQ